MQPWVRDTEETSPQEKPSQPVTQLRLVPHSVGVLVQPVSV